MLKSDTHFLYPSTLYASNEDKYVLTILGSCVAICFWDPIKEIGGVNHYMLPFWNGRGLPSPKYGNIAIEKLLERMIKLGSKKKNIKAKVFGGGEVIETNIKMFNIGERNIRIAYEILKEHNIPVISSSTGGKNGRKIIFHTRSGKVSQKIIQKNIIK